MEPGSNIYDAAARVAELLQNAGITVRGADGAYIYIEDPSCIIRTFDTFLEFAWMVLTFITGILLAGWAWAMIRGSKNAELSSIANNFKNLLLVFLTLSAVPAVVNAIYGDKLVDTACPELTIPLDTAEQMLNERDKALNKNGELGLYEKLVIYDTGINEQLILDAAQQESEQVSEPQMPDFLRNAIEFGAVYYNTENDTFETTAPNIESDTTSNDTPN